MKRFFPVLLAALLMLGFLAACGGDSGQTTPPEDGQTAGMVVIGGQSDLVTLDPGNMYEPYGNMMSYACYDMLYRIQSGTMGTPEPSVATSYEVDATGMVYTFPLREDVIFSSGNPLTAHDVVWSFNRVLNMKESNAYANIRIIESAVALDDYTVQVTLTQPDASFLVKLTSNAYCILDSAVVAEHGGTDGSVLDADGSPVADTAKGWLDQNSAGSGPFVIEKWTPQVELVLVKNENYWKEATNVDKIIFREMTSVDAQITALKKGEIDIALGLNNETVKQLAGVENVAIETGDTALLTFLVMSRDSSLSAEMSNPLVQEAVRYALDYEGYAELCGDGAKIPLNFVQDGFAGALQRDLATDGQDIEKARELMEEAGYADGFSIELTIATNNSEGLSWVTIGEKVKQDLDAIGIDVKLSTQETSLVYEQMRSSSMPFYVMFWSPDYYDINNQIEAFLPGTGEGGTAYGNRTQWPITEENELLWQLGNQVRTETDEAERAAVSEQLQKAYAEDNPLAFLLQHPKTFAYRSDNLEAVTYNDLCKIELCELILK